MQKDNEATRAWSQSAPYWEKHRETILQMFAPVTQALIEDAQIAQGHSVLDVGTGPGEPALTVAATVGPGSVVGVDPSPEMIAAATRAAHRNNLRNVRFEVASADLLSFPKDTFDAAVSRFGVMFFPSPVEGVREMLRVLKPNRKLAFAVWHFAEKNPFHCFLSRVMDRYVPAEPPPPDSPDAFRFAVPGKLVHVLTEAGATAVSERLLQFRIEASLSAEDFWTLRSEMSEKLRTKLATLSKDQFAAVRDETIQGLRPYATAGGVSFPAEVWIVSGSKR